MALQMKNLCARPPRRSITFLLSALALMLGPGLGTAAAAPSANPPVTSGLQLWFEANTESYANGAAVQRWTDKTAFGRDLTASGAGAAATFRTNALNGRSALEFDGTTSLLKTYEDTFSLAQPTTFFIVYKSLDTNTGARAFVFDSRNSSVRQVLGRPAQGQIRLYANADLDLPGVTYPFSNYELWSGTYNGASSALYRNGFQFGSGYAGGSSLDGLSVGGLNSAGSNGYDMSHSLVAEILYYSGAMSAADRTAVTDWLNEKYAVIGPPTPPVNATAPAISGTAKDGSTLTTSNGTWTGTQPISYGYQWQRCNSSGAACAVIAGATAATYTAGSADVGGTLRSVVTATNSAGNASQTSASTAVIVAAPPSNTAAPTISGSAREGQTLTANRGTWAGTSPITYGYQWRRCERTGAGCTDIAGATSATYTAVTADVNSILRVVVAATNSLGNANATSAASGVVGAASAGGQPPVTTGLQLWFDANAESYGDGDQVTQWSDRSGFGRDLTAASSSAAPIYRAASINGRASVEFDGSSSLMKTYNSTFTLPQPTTFFIVYKSLDVATPGHEAYILDSRDSANRQLFGLGPFTNTELYANTDIELPTPYPFPDYQIWSGTLDGSNSAGYRNNVLVASGYAGGGTLGTGFTMGGLSTAGTGGYLLSHSFVAEVLYYQGPMSLANREATTDWLNTKYKVIGPPSPPANTTAPAISGTAKDGSTLTSSTGTWTGSAPITYGYQWQRCNSGGGSCSNIAGAQSATYGASNADIGSTLRVTVTGTNSVGNATAQSAATAVVTAAAPSNSALPTITGSARDGQTLTADKGTWSGTSPIGYAYQWQRCSAAGASCANIASATNQTYGLGGADIGSTVRVVVTASNSIGSTSANSQVTSVVGAANSAGQPPVTTGLQLWFDANAESYANGAKVTRWSDASGFGRDLTAADTTSAPTFRSAAVNGRAAIEFDGVSSLMKTYEDTFSLSQPTTFFIVYKSLDPTSVGQTYVFDSRNSLTRQLLGRGPLGATELYANNDLNANGVAYPFLNYQVWSGTLDGTLSSVWQNNTRLNQGYAGFAALDGFSVGALSTAGTAGYYYGHSMVAEVLYYTGTMSDTSRGMVSDWLNQKYAAY
jgi:hypothetical protein